MVALVGLDQRSASVVEELEPPTADILVLDCGGSADTVAFNAVEHSHAQ